jgi:hypothetical protein
MFDFDVVTGPNTANRFAAASDKPAVDRDRSVTPAAARETAARSGDRRHDDGSVPPPHTHFE